MNEQKQGFINWVKAHKKELIVAGVSIGAIIATMYCYRKRDNILELWKKFKVEIRKLPSNTSTNSLVVDSISESVPIRADLISPLDNTVIIPIRESTNKPFGVSEHIRNLPDGWHASATKIATASEHGYELLPGQTWVDNYTKNVKVA